MMATIDYVFRLQEADWDFGPGVGIQKVMCYHQFVDADGFAADHTDPAAGTWEPFIPGPEIRARSVTRRRLVHDLKADGRMELGRVSWLFHQQRADEARQTAR